MSLNEKFPNAGAVITANTVSEGDYVLFFDGESEVSVGGVFDTCNVAYHTFSEKYGRGPEFRTAVTAADAFASKTGFMEFVVTSVGASTALEIVGRPVISVS